MTTSILSRIQEGVLNPLLDLVYPPRCLGCGAPVHHRDVLCGACITDMMELPMDRAGSDELLVSLTYPPPVTCIAAGYDYEKESIVETCLHTMKYRGMHYIGDWLGRLLGERLHGMPLLEGNPILIPVPLNKVKRIERGYNQAEHIARGIGIETGLELRTDILKRTRYTESQSFSKLSQEERLDNLAGAFGVDAESTHDILTRPLILVDDIITTGATLGSCVAALKEAGFSDVRIAVVAHPVRS